MTEYVLILLRKMWKYYELVLGSGIVSRLDLVLRSVVINVMPTDDHDDDSSLFVDILPLNIFNSPNIGGKIQANKQKRKKETDD